MRVVPMAIAACALVACHGDTVLDFPGDSSTDGATNDASSDSTTRDSGISDSKIDATTDTVADTFADGGGDSTSTDSAASDASIDVPFVDSGTLCGSYRGGAMVEIDLPADAGGGWFCIDAKEVTAGDYKVFLASPTGFAAKCPSGHDYTPSPSVTPADDHPVVGVEWCDAYDYCQWAGKRLCGDYHGGPSSEANRNVLSVDAWYYACSDGVGSKYPYGTSYVAGTCNTGTPAATVPPGSLSGCHGAPAPFTAIFDMSGNVAEWEDACDSPSSCPSRGGWAGEGSDSACDATGSQAATTRNDFTGFRCCSK